MSIMSKISKPADRAFICTILGDAGMGKTSFAATFPKPIFIRAEDGMSSIPEAQRPDAFPVLTKTDDLWEQLGALIKEQHDYKTVVIDSVTVLERMFIQDVIDSDPKKPKSLNQALGGFQNGAQAVGTLHQRVRKGAGILLDKGINVAFIGHAEFQTVEPPDGDKYMRYSLRLGKYSIAPYTDDVDLVGFIRLETFFSGDSDKKRAISDGSRELVCHAVASNISKNRLGINAPLPLPNGKNPLAAYVKSLSVGV